MFTILAVVLAVAFMLSPFFYATYCDVQTNKELEAWQNRRK